MKKWLGGIAGTLTLLHPLPALAQGEAEAQAGNWFSQMIANDPKFMVLLVTSVLLIAFGLALHLFMNNKNRRK